MAWSAIGDGKSVALLIPGGPGNFPPDVGRRGKLALGPIRCLLDHAYRICTVTRKRNLPADHSVEDMASDYATMIDREFGGSVNLIIGSSYGGMIGLHIAANHPDCFNHIVIHVAACRINQAARPIDQAFAENLARGKHFAAGAAISAALFPDTRFPRLVACLNGLVAKFTASTVAHDFFAADILIEVEAEHRYDATEALTRITKRVLLIGGDEDFYFPIDLLHETAELIPDCRLKVYAGKGHIGAAIDKRLSTDIVEFVNELGTDED